jgi:hypothetical protein
MIRIKPKKNALYKPLIVFIVAILSLIILSLVSLIYYSEFITTDFFLLGILVVTNGLTIILHTNWRNKTDLAMIDERVIVFATSPFKTLVLESTLEYSIQLYPTKLIFQIEKRTEQFFPSYFQKKDWELLLESLKRFYPHKITAHN